MRLSGGPTRSAIGPTIVRFGPTIVSLGLILVSLGPTIRAQPATLDLVIARATEYIVDYQFRLSGVVAEETYLQVWERRPGTVAQRRELKSDVLLVKPPGLDRYVQFRDVFEVDGDRVRDREDRLSRLFLDTSVNGSTQLARIIDESARYNIGNIDRTMNVPTLPLLFLDPLYQERFRFSRSNERVPETIKTQIRGGDASEPLFSVSAEVWVVDYRETGRNTLIRTAGGLDLPARGRFWIEPETGKVVMTELSVGDATVQGLVDVTYGFEEGAGMVVPIAMRERYRNQRTMATIDGAATYSRFRKFNVTVTDDNGR